MGEETKVESTEEAVEETKPVEEATEETATENASEHECPKCEECAEDEKEGDTSDDKPAEEPEAGA